MPDDSRAQTHQSDEEDSATRWLDIREVAQSISASASFVRKLIRSGRLRAVNIGFGDQRAEWRIRRTDLDAFMDAPQKKDEGALL